LKTSTLFVAGLASQLGRSPLSFTRSKSRPFPPPDQAKWRPSYEDKEVTSDPRTTLEFGFTVSFLSPAAPETMKMLLTQGRSSHAWKRVEVSGQSLTPPLLVPLWKCSPGPQAAEHGVQSPQATSHLSLAAMTATAVMPVCVQVSFLCVCVRARTTYLKLAPRSRV